jgi:hypothetical protein
MAANESLLVAAPLMIAAIVMAVRFVGCGLDDSPLPGDGNGGDGDGDGPRVIKGEFYGKGVLSAEAGFPENKPDRQEYDNAGTYTYAIPYWCDTIDIVLLGGGGGGVYGEFNVGAGGVGGSWKAITVQRGSDIPWAATAITVVVGQGGAGGSLATPQGGPGGDTTASWDTSPGTTTETAPGGLNAAAPDLTGTAPDPGSETAGQATLNAGAAQPTSGAAGNAPGGGGAGSSNGLQPGGSGADGSAVLVARQQNQ